MKKYISVLSLIGFCVLSLSAGTSDVATIYKKRCSNCHGVKAEGIPKIKPKPLPSTSELEKNGIVSETPTNVYGPPLNHFSKEELIKKLAEIRGKGSEDLDENAHHSAMSYNLKAIEQREGKISDEEMAKYISETFNK